MKPTDGFTIVELLIGMAILSILMIAVFNFQQSTASFALDQNSAAQRLQTINDISGYLGDGLRAASGIAPSGTSLPDGTSANTLSSCTQSGSSPCLALLLPVVEDERGATACGTTPATEPGRIVGWTLKVYRYVPRSQLEAALLTNNVTALNDAAQGIMEIQLENPSKPMPKAGVCGATQPLPDPISAYTTVVGRNLITDLAIVGTDPAFEYDSTKKYVTLRVRTVEIVKGKLIYTPSSGPYTTRVNLRNL